MLGSILELLSVLALKKRMGKVSSLLQVLETATNFIKWMELFRILINGAAEFNQPS